MPDSTSQTNPSTQRKRTSTPRSKTGCVTCRIRRLKCGEEKPSCIRCTKSGWQCDGYDHLNMTRSRRRSLSPPTAHFSNLLPRRASDLPPPQLPIGNNIDLDEKEYMYFRSFIDEVSVQLPSHDAFFWGGIVLQESHLTSSVRHGIAAIGALFKSCSKVLSGVHRFEPGFSPHREFALQQYQKGIQGLRRASFPIVQQEGARATLISCIILAFFDNFIGNGGSALQHVQCGREVLSKTLPNMQNNSAEIKQDLGRVASMFLRLDMETYCAMGTEVDNSYVALKKHEPFFNFPSQLSSIEEALLLRNPIVWEGYDLFYRTTKYQSVPLNQIPLSIIDERDRFIEKLRLLNNLLDLLVQTTIPDFASHPLRRTDALKLPSVVLLVRLASGLGGPVSLGHDLVAEFGYLFGICKAAIEYERLMNPIITAGEVFSFDVRVIAALFLVATKCQSIAMRRQATNLLLSSHRREWMYDSLLAGKIASWMLDLQEQSFIPASQRPPLEMPLVEWSNIFDNQGIGTLDADWVGGSDLVNFAIDGLETEREMNLAWGAVVDWKANTGRKAKVKCRLNRKGPDGMISWSWRESDVVW